jgi:hypothetical protein
MTDIPDATVSDLRLRELIRAYADCGCGLGPFATCVDTGRALRELERRRVKAPTHETLPASKSNDLADAVKLLEWIAEGGNHRSAFPAACASAVLEALRTNALETCELPQAPIAKLTVWENGIQVTASMYAPGLPPGEHDVYLDPAVPGIPGNTPKAGDQP